MNFLADIKKLWSDGWNALNQVFIDVWETMKITLKELVNKIKDAFSIDWTKLGKEIVDGIVKGITDNAKKIAAAAKKLAQAALKAAMEFLGIGSPSKVFMKLGVEMSAGTILGMKRMTGEIQRTAVESASSAVAGMRWAVSPLTSALPGATMDAQPLTTNAYRYNTVNMGGVNVYSGLDEQALMNRIEQTLSRMIGG